MLVSIIAVWTLLEPKLSWHYRVSVKLNPIQERPLEQANSGIFPFFLTLKADYLWPSYTPKRLVFLLASVLIGSGATFYPQIVLVRGRCKKRAMISDALKKLFSLNTCMKRVYMYHTCICICLQFEEDENNCCDQFRICNMEYAVDEDTVFFHLYLLES